MSAPETLVGVRESLVVIDGRLTPGAIADHVRAAIDEIDDELAEFAAKRRAADENGEDA